MRKKDNKYVGFTFHKMPASTNCSEFTFGCNKCNYYIYDIWEKSLSKILVLHLALKKNGVCIHIHFLSQHLKWFWFAHMYIFFKVTILPSVLPWSSCIPLVSPPTFTKRCSYIVLFSLNLRHCTVEINIIILYGNRIYLILLPRCPTMKHETLTLLKVPVASYVKAFLYSLL